MKKLTKEEFESRMVEIQNAESIFIHSGLMNNISKAFEIYQRLLGEGDHPVYINNDVADGRRGMALDEYDRPECPHCGRDMFIKVFMPSESKMKTRLVCPNETCPSYDSDKTVEQWKQLLKRRKADEDKP